MCAVTGGLCNECPIKASKRQGREDEVSLCGSYTVLGIESHKDFSVFMSF